MWHPIDNNPMRILDYHQVIRFTHQIIHHDEGLNVHLLERSRVIYRYISIKYYNQVNNNKERRGQ